VQSVQKNKINVFYTHFIKKNNAIGYVA